LPALEPPGSDSAGLSPIRVHGASEKCGATFGDIHTRCTVFPQLKFFLAKECFIHFYWDKRKNFLFGSVQNYFFPILGLLKTRTVYKFIFKRQVASFAREKKTDQHRGRQKADEPDG
jgi:hypothetical protein